MNKHQGDQGQDSLISSLRSQSPEKAFKWMTNTLLDKSTYLCVYLGRRLRYAGEERGMVKESGKLSRDINTEVLTVAFKDPHHLATLSCLHLLPPRHAFAPLLQPPPAPLRAIKARHDPLEPLTQQLLLTSLSLIFFLLR